MVGDNMVTRDDLVDNLARTRSAIADVKNSIRDNQDLRVELGTKLDDSTLSEAIIEEIEDMIDELEYEYTEYELELMDLRDHRDDVEYDIAIFQRDVIYESRES